jgi:diguanylate cyclase (GGDEF)-like protein
MHNISRIEIQAMLVNLERAIDNHQRWYETVVKILVCRLPFEPHYAADDAHRACEFGAWYYSDGFKQWRGRAGFVALEGEHERMHKMAARLLREMAAGKQLRVEDYEAFAASLANLRLQLQSLDRELHNALGDLDPLTGAYNRISMLTWLREQQELVRRNVLSCGLTMIDLDYFKSINDTYGHPLGDRVLAHTAAYLIGHIRPYDKLFRYGGEEFLLCIADADIETCRVLVDRLRDGLANTPAIANDLAITCRASCGVALLDREQTVETAIERADRAMYSAKHAGRNRTHVWDASMSQ